MPSSSLTHAQRLCCKSAKVMLLTQVNVLNFYSKRENHSMFKNIAVVGLLAPVPNVALLIMDAAFWGGAKYSQDI